MKREGKGREVNLAYLVGDLGGHCSEVGGREGSRVEREAVGVVVGEGWFWDWIWNCGNVEMWKCGNVEMWKCKDCKSPDWIRSRLFCCA